VTARNVGWLLGATLLAALPSYAAGPGASYQPVLYPNGLPVRHSELSDRDEQTSFTQHAALAVPGTSQTVVVYSEGIKAESPHGDNLYWVFAAVVAPPADGMRVIDRQELTNDVPVYTEFPGHVLEVQAAVHSFPARGGKTIVAVELYGTLAGSGALSDASNLFFLLHPDGRLTRALALARTSGSGRSGAGEGGATESRISVGTAAGVLGDIVLEKRGVRWTHGPSDPKPVITCGATSIEAYRFTGDHYERIARPPGALGAGFISLARLPFLEKTSCRFATARRTRD
jgi:hypothetical protein